MFLLDRFEGDFAVIEVTENNQVTILKVDKILVSSDVREGDILVYDNDLYITDVVATEERRKIIREKLIKLRK